MLLTEDEVNTRINSPLNLINRMKALASQREVIDVPYKQTKEQAEIISLPPSIDTLVSGLDDKLAYNKISKKALAVLDSTLAELHPRLQEVDVDKLASVAAEMNRIVHGINESKTLKIQDNRIQIQIYRPVYRNEAEYESVSAIE